MLSFKAKFFVTILLFATVTSEETCTWSDDSESSCCDINESLRDKWYFPDDNKTTFLRIRQRVMVTHDEANGKVRYRCVEKYGNIFLIRKKVYRPNRDGVICLGFSYTTDHDTEMNRLIRYNGPGVGNHLLSPQLVRRDEIVSINTTCDLLRTEQKRPSARLTRSPPGCRIPTEIRGEWRYTLKIARRLIVDVKYMSLVLMNNTVIKLNCESRDGNMFLLRVKNYEPGKHDALMCLKIERIDFDPHYTYKLSRLNSGNVLHNQLRLLKPNEELHLHTHCDWIESPGIAEYLYPF